MITISWREGLLHLAFERMSAAQAEALDCTQEIAVSAGAGAGKTSTLAARYVTLLQRLVEADPDDLRPDIRAVLVLTFTEKAAQEMRERCYLYTSAVARALRSDADRLVTEGLPVRRLARLRAAWEWLRDRFGGASISTFHGFCARLLREFPAETRTPPGFEVLEESDAGARVFAAANTELELRLAADEPDILLLLRCFGGRASLVAQVASLVRARGEVRDTLCRHAAGEVTEADVLARSPVSPDDARRWLTQTWASWVERLVSVVGGIRTAWLDRLEEVAGAAWDLPDDPLAVLEIYAGALRALTKSDGGLRNLAHHLSTGKKADWGARWTGTRGALADLQAQLDGWKGRLDESATLPNRHDRTLLDVLRALSTVTLAAANRHGAGLDEAGAVDFAELQLRVRDADPVLVAELRARHRWVMVDEFQDTDALQWSIVERLTRPGHDRLFFVGDVKQAIYGFRGGDVTVFDAAARTVARRVELSANYRSRPAVIGWLNGLFADVLGAPAGSGDAGRPAWEAPFAALSAGRKASSSQENGGTVRIASYPKRSAAGSATLEAAWIAGLLAEEVLAERAPYDGLSLHDVRVHPTPPVAILLRRRTWLATYETALRARGVPYVVVGGVGFWNRPEVVDIANTLHALARHDAISTLAALRSPLFGLTDQQILDLSDAGVLVRFGEAPLPHDIPERGALLVADEAWRTLRRVRDHLSLAELVDTLLRMTRQSWQQGVLAPGGRGAANLDRLLAMADAHEQTGGSLDAFAARLLQQVDDDARDAEAVLPFTDARVALLTVHASKGLEWPVVVVPDLGSAFRFGRDAGVLRRRVGDRWELACDVPDRHAALQQTATPGATAQLRAHARAVELAEARRLLYVACTRARDHLVLVGQRGKNPSLDDPGSWSDLVMAHLGARGEAGQSTQPEGETRVDLEHWIAPDRELPPPAPLDEPPSDIATRLADVAFTPRITLAPSSLGLYAADREQWRLRHLYGMPEVSLEPGGGLDGGPQLASIRGDVLHGLLEDNMFDDDDVAQARWAAAAFSAGISEADVEAGWPAVREQLVTLRESEDLAGLLRATGYAELPVTLREGPVTVQGRIDRLCRDPGDGAWMVVDYKSVRVEASLPSGGVDDQLRKHRDQLLAYSVAASRVLEAHGHPPVRRAALFFTRTGRLERLPDWTAEDFAGIEARLRAVGMESR